MTDEKPIPDTDWKIIVENVPLVSVDLVVRHGDGVVLGQRTNAPAKGEWFVPGGTVLKSERLEDAVHRVAETELGTSVTIERQLGVYEHFWKEAEFGGIEGKHYVPVGYLVSTDGARLSPDDQHDSLDIFTPPFDEVDLHEYVTQYLEDADII